MTQAEALAKLLRSVDLSVEPALTEQEANDALSDTVRHGVRGASQLFGDRIAVNGRLYKCVWAGDTAETLPVSFGRTCYGRRVSDGTATWEDIGEAPASAYDLNAAKWQLYNLRVQRSAELYNQTDKDMRDDVESVHKHWVAERAKVVCLRAV